MVLVPFTTNATTANRIGWLTVYPSSGQVLASKPADLTISLNPELLSAGIHTGEISLQVGNTVRFVNVTLITTSRLLADAARITTPRTASACTRSQLTLTSTGLPNGFQTAAGWPGTLTALLYDNCGAPIDNANAWATFSNGDSPLVLLPNGVVGAYSATWQPGADSSNTKVRFSATFPGLPPATPLIVGEVLPNKAPTLTPNGTVDNLNPQLRGALAPGTIVQIYGSDLAASAVSPAQVPLPLSYNWEARFNWWL